MDATNEHEQNKMKQKRRRRWRRRWKERKPQRDQICSLCPIIKRVSFFLQKKTSKNYLSNPIDFLAFYRDFFFTLIKFS